MHQNIKSGFGGDDVTQKIAAPTKILILSTNFNMQKKRVTSIA